MTTYATIKQAFANGTGDVFYTDGNTFICFSRHDDRDDQMKAEGFTRMTYFEVTVCDRIQKVEILRGRFATGEKLILNGYAYQKGVNEQSFLYVIDAMLKGAIFTESMDKSITTRAGNLVKSWSNTSNGRDGYYDEFPDAYGQNL